MDMCQKYHHYLLFEDKKVRLYPSMTFDSLAPRKSQVYILTGNLSGTPLPPLVLRHVAPRILGQVLLPSAAKKVGLDPSSRLLTLSRPVNHKFTF